MSPTGVIFRLWGESSDSEPEDSSPPPRPIHPPSATPPITTPEETSTMSPAHNFQTYPPVANEHYTTTSQVRSRQAHDVPRVAHNYPTAERATGPLTIPNSVRLQETPLQSRLILNTVPSQDTAPIQRQFNEQSTRGILDNEFPFAYTSVGPSYQSTSPLDNTSSSSNSQQSSTNWALPAKDDFIMGSRMDGDSGSDGLSGEDRKFLDGYNRALMGFCDKCNGRRPKPGWANYFVLKLGEKKCQCGVNAFATRNEEAEKPYVPREHGQTPTPNNVNLTMRLTLRPTVVSGLESEMSTLSGDTLTGDNMTEDELQYSPETTTN